MIAKLKDYWIIISSLLLAILGVMLYTRNSNLRDLQSEIINKKADDKIRDANMNLKLSDGDYQKKLKRYKKLKEKYGKTQK